MSKALPWSFTHWEEFTACPRLFHAKRVAKTVVEPMGAAAAYGVELHSHFEKRQKNGCPLPADIIDQHEPFMTVLEGMAGEAQCEYEACLSYKMEPCKFFSKDVWYRAKVDYMKVLDRMAYVCDYKTGNPNYPKPEQLEQNALALFIHYPKVEVVKAEFYWTKLRETKHTLMIFRDKAGELWNKFLPSLGQLREAYETDVWQPRQNFRCNGFCPLTDCEFWKEKR
jgi:hypothetical protein